MVTKDQVLFFVRRIRNAADEMLTTGKAKAEEIFKAEPEMALPERLAIEEQIKQVEVQAEVWNHALQYLSRSIPEAAKFGTCACGDEEMLIDGKCSRCTPEVAV